VQLARHFEAAGIAAKVTGYLLLAGNKAVRLSAYQEAIAHYRKGLELLETLPDTAERARQELALQMGLGVPLAAIRGYADPEMGQAYARARELCRQLGATPELAPVLTGLGGFYSLQAQYQIARELFEEILAVSQRSADPTLLTVAHWHRLLVGQIEECSGAPTWSGRSPFTTQDSTPPWHPSTIKTPACPA
jgi:tetratricopeptide (TPR) repeat protein